MFAPTAPIALDVTTLFFVATFITALLGLFLLFAWLQDRIRALAWWGGAYLIGGFSVAVWSIESLISPPLPPGLSNALLFIACGMIWNAARLFHGRRVRWGALFAGATVWMIACTAPDFVQSGAARIVLSSIIVSSYTFLTALELWRERRKRLLRRWPAIFVPILHGAVFLFPIPLAGIIPADRGVIALSSGWIAVFTLETMLYVVGTAFIVLVLSKERAVRHHKNAAATDELTRLLNRRGFVVAAKQLMAAQEKNKEQVSVLLFDLDHFKSINDRFGHAVGDEAIKLFAATVSSTMRASDIIGRFGGEEFVAMVPGPVADAAVAAERVRSAFQAAAVEFAGHAIAATVSIGVASGAATAHIETLIASADGALYRAKSNGRNRLETADELVPGATAIRAGAAARPRPAFDPEARATQLLQAAEQRAA
jgi:diguanylate cyclase (GGDEF)-like protein